jgi:glycosyltransferase involved in cell wall biosynthesis
MRIAQVAALWSSIPPRTYGGIELLIWLLVEELVRRGHDVTLFASGDSRTSARLHAINDVNAIDAMTSGGMYDYEYYAAAAMAEVVRDAACFDVIHCHLGTSKIPLSVLSPTPIVHTLHTAVTVDDEWVFRRCPAVPVVAVSHSQVASLDAGCRDRIRVVHNACDVEAYDLADPPGDYLAFLGRMGAHKNPLDAIRLAKAVGLPIVLAGAPQSPVEERYFAEQIRPLIDGSSVRYVGLVDYEQKRAFLRNAAAFVFPTSWPEPFGLVMIEALASGLPVLAYQNGSVSEVIDYGVTGFYAPSLEGLVPLVPQALSLDRPAIREHARRRFHHVRMTDEYEAVYDEVIARRSQPSSPLPVAPP